jgi:competence protein ComEC
MDTRERSFSFANAAPAFWPATAAVAGCLVALRAVVLPVALIALGAAVTLTWWRNLVPLAFFAGCLLAIGHGVRPMSLSPPSSGPAELIGRLVGHPDGHGEERRLLLQVESVRQGRQIRRWRQEVLVFPAFATESRDDAFVWGRRLRLRGTLRLGSPPLNLGEPWPAGWRLTVKSHHFVEPMGPAPSLGLAAVWLRRQAELKLERWTGSTETGGLLRCLLLGDRSQLPKRWLRVLTALGMVHVLSISGLHVSLVAALSYLILSMLGVRRRWLLLTASSLAVLGFIAIVGPQPAALRAGAMFLLALGALGLVRPPQLLNSLALAAAGMVALEPNLLEDIGFRLSVAATFGLVGLGPLLAQEFSRRRFLPASWRLPLAASIGAEMASGPLIWPLTAVLHPLAFVLNLALAPWLGLQLLVSGLWLSAPDPLARPLGILLEALTWPLDWLAAWTASRWLVLPWSVGTLAAFGPPAAVALAVCGGSRGRMSLLLAASLMIVPGLPPAAPPEIVFVDVGQGDAIVVRDGREAILIDGGGWRRGDIGARVLLPTLAHLGVTQLRAVAPTHDDLDHCGGLVDLGAYWRADNLWLPASAAVESKKVVSSCLRELADLYPDHRPLGRGGKMRLGAWELEALWPTPGADGSANEHSLVLVGRLGGRRYLLTGDIDARTERALLAMEPRSLDTDLLKVAHHGSKSSTSAAFLRAATPRVAVVSVGKGNGFGHPHESVVERLESRPGLWLLRTDRGGMVRIRTLPGDGWVIEQRGLVTMPP